MLTPRENLLAVFRHEMPEWIPIVGHVDPYNQPNQRGMDPALAEQLRDVRWGDESTIHFSRYLGLDIMDFFGPPIIERHRQVKIERTTENNTTITRWQTPRGELREVQRFSPDTNMWYVEEHTVKEVSDLPLLAAVFADMEFEVIPERLEAVKRKREMIGDDGLLIFSLPGTPLGQMIRVHAGVENIAYLYADGSEELHALFAVMEENHQRRASLALSLGLADGLVSMDDTSTTTLSPAMFEEYCLGYTDRLADIAHTAGAVYLHHSCGLIRDLLDLYRRTKMDAVHAFTVPPVGDVTIAEGRRKLGSGIVIIAGLTQLLAAMDDRNAVATSIRTMIEEAQPGDNIILGLAPDPDRTMDETQFILDECRKYTGTKATTPAR